LLLLPATIGISATNLHSASENLPPEVSLTSQSGNSVSFGWAAVEGAVLYQAYYVKVENNYSSPQNNTGSTGITFSNLSPGTYKFFFRSVFDRSQTSDYVIIEDIVIAA
jgi:hypothetical protein